METQFNSRGLHHAIAKQRTLVPEEGNYTVLPDFQSKMCLITNAKVDFLHFPAAEGHKTGGAVVISPSHFPKELSSPPTLPCKEIPKL